MIARHVASAIVLLSACASRDDAPSGMIVTVQKRLGGAECFSTLGGDALDEDIAKKLDDACSSPDRSPPRGGSDFFRLVIDYGDIEFEKASTVPRPTIEEIVDGQSRTSNATLVWAGTAKHAVFLASLPAPPQRVDWLFLNVNVGDGLSRGPLGPFTVQAPVVQVIPVCPASGCTHVAGVGVQQVDIRATGDTDTQAALTWTLDGVKQATTLTVSLTPEPNNPGHVFGTAFPRIPDVGGEWTLFAQVGRFLGHSSTFTVAAGGLEVEPICPAAGCSPTAGVGVQPVEIRATGDRATDATLTWTIDGVRQTSSAPVPLKPDPSSPDHVFGSVFVPVPAAAGDWVLLAQVGSISSSSSSIRIEPNVVSTRILGCSDAACEQAAAVGSAALEVTVGGTTAIDARITSFLAGVPQGGESVVNLRPVDGNMLLGMAFIRVPIAQDQTRWTLRTEVGTLAPAFAEVVLRRPEILLRIAACPEEGACELEPGETVTISVVAPARVQGGQATVTTSVDGRLGTPVTIALEDDLSQGIAAGSIEVQAPSSPGSSWVVSAKVAGFSAPSVIALIENP